MRNSRLFFRTGAILLVSAFIFTLSYSYLASQSKEAKKTTLDNLQEAYNGESNAHARYVAFAKKADEEGFKQAARLFRAAARAEEIHFKKHASVIRKMGGTPKADIKKPEVKSTKENLEAAIKGETYERDVMYPAFIKQARAEKNKDALKSFNGAKEAEGEHAKLYSAALNDLNNMKKAVSAYMVCPECGYTVITADFKKCPVCFTKKEKFEKIS